MRRTLKSFKKYWVLYGGTRALLRSFYLWAAILITVVCTPSWLESQWFDVVISVLPGIVAFSLAGYAILLSFGDDKFKRLLAGRSAASEKATYLEINATFVHFIVVQTFAIVAAIAMKGWMTAPSPQSKRYAVTLWMYGNGILPGLKYLTSFFSFFLFSYSLTLILAAAMTVFQMGQWFDSYQEKETRRGQAASPLPAPQVLVAATPAPAAIVQPHPSHVPPQRVEPAPVEEVETSDEDEVSEGRLRK